ncbi:serine-rich adhesin for platelets-like [Littorina saxatilis]|uniref:serine-rich adhesin for platelets-like n=1 Tax=Littorina saxatilis TaxID=31220 RepID=UPI0038B4F5AB
MAAHGRTVKVVLLVVVSSLLLVPMADNSSIKRFQCLLSQEARGVKQSTRNKASTDGAADLAQTLRSAGRHQNDIPRNLSFSIPLSCQVEGIREKTSSIVATDLRFNIIMMLEGRYLSKLLYFIDLASSRFESVALQRFAQLTRLQNSTIPKIPLTCEQTARQDASSPAEETFSCDWFPMETNIFIHVHSIQLLHSYHPKGDSVLQSRSLLSERERSKHDSETLPNRTIAIPKADETVEDSELPRKKHFQRFPFWCKIFSSHNWPYDHFSNVNYFTNDALLNDVYIEVLISFVCLMHMLYIYVSQTEETRKPCDNNADQISLLHLSFFLKGKLKDWTNSFKMKWQTGGKDASENSSKWLFSTKSIADTLDEYIFRPWLQKVEPLCNESCSRSPTPNTCTSFNSSPFSTCLKRLENFTATQNHHVSIQVSPVRSFLPNPTFNPALDLAHVGYRLATLGALPARVPTSRIKLADAGFYFRGQGDEVICYSCEKRHSGWTRQDNPLEIHRRLSPECSHILQRDRESASLARPQSNSTDTPSAGRETEVQAPPQANNNVPVEDGESSSPPARPQEVQSTASRQEIQAPQRHVLTNGSLPVSDASASVTESLVISGASARERTPSATTSAATASNRTIPNSNPSEATNTASSAGTPNATRETNSNVSRSNNSSDNARTATANASNTVTESRPSTNASPSPVASSSNGGGNHGNAAHAEPRSLFPRAGLDLGGAVYPMYQDMASRRRTFTQWDDTQAPPLDHVILSGMFYAGYADCVRCFYCGVGLKHWVPTDDVWTEHVRWRPGCEYLRTVKGDDFIRETQRRIGIEPDSSGQNTSRSRSDGAQATSTQQQRQPATTTSIATSSTLATSPAAATATTTTTSANSQVSRTAPSANSGSQNGALAPRTTTAATAASNGQAGVVVTSSGATSTSTTPSSPRNGHNNQGGNIGAGTGVAVAPSATEERERLARLQADNRAMTQRLQCRVCHNAAIDTILMPCGHLVLCESCAGSVTSCPLCHDAIRATARVHMAKPRNKNETTRSENSNCRFLNPHVTELLPSLHLQKMAGPAKQRLFLVINLLAIKHVEIPAHNRLPYERMRAANTENVPSMTLPNDKGSSSLHLKTGKQEARVVSEINLCFHFKPSNGQASHKICDSAHTMLASTEIASGRGRNRHRKGMSGTIALSCQSEETTKKIRSLAAKDRCCKKMFGLHEWNCTKLTCFIDLSASRPEFSQLKRFAQLILQHSPAAWKARVDDEQCLKQIMYSTGKETFPFSWFPMTTSIFFRIYGTELLCNCQPISHTVLESRSKHSQSKLTDDVTPSSSAGTLQKSDQVIIDSSTSSNKHFQSYSFWSNIFSSYNWPNGIFSNVILNDSLRDLLVLILCLMTILFKYLPKTLKTKEHRDKTVYLRILTHSFFLKWKWEDWAPSLKKESQTSIRNAIKPPYSKSLRRSKSLLEVLNEHIFRQWRIKARPHETENCCNSCKSQVCISFDVSPCSSCLQHLENFRSAPYQRVSIQVNPVARFLPDPTRNPALDLAHVGYRLATLSALPAYVPTSRIKLADAGFYFRGQHDEVICYSCGERHSEWSREDNPMEIHRRLSPHCPHVMQRVAESVALSHPQSNSGGVSRNDQETVGQEASLANTNIPTEDGESSPWPHQGDQTTSAQERQSSPRQNGSAGSVPVSGLHGSATESLVISGASVAERTEATATSSAGSRPNAGNGTHSSLDSVRTTSAISSSERSSTTPTTNSRTEFRSSTSARPSPMASSGNHGNAARAESRPLFPRAALDLGGAVYPMYQDMASRRRTFTQWDDSQAPPLDHVILSGMFYAGYADCVRCFYCGVGLKHWVATDDVWTEHVRWRPGCEYLRAVKGDDFIRETQRRLGIETDSSGQNTNNNPRDLAQPASRQQQQPPTTATVNTSSSSSTISTPATTTTATTSDLARNQAPLATSSNSSNSRAEAGSSGATSSSQAQSSLRPGNGSNCNPQNDDSGTGSGADVMVAPSAAEERERLARLHAENRTMTQRLQCRACHNATIDTILMPCGHLVLCESCAGSVTSCPLCHDAIRATARVHMG